MNYYLEANGVTEISLSAEELLSYYVPNHEDRTFRADTLDFFKGLIDSPRVLFLSPALTTGQMFATGMVDEDESYFLTCLVQEITHDRQYAVVTDIHRDDEHLLVEMFLIHHDSQPPIDVMLRKTLIDDFLMENA